MEITVIRVHNCASLKNSFLRSFYSPAVKHTRDTGEPKVTTPSLGQSCSLLLVTVVEL